MLKKPENLQAPRFGILTFGISQQGNPLETLVILDEPAREVGKLIIDHNRNGDLTDDVVVTWELKSQTYPNGRQASMYNATAQLPLSDASESPLVQLGFYRFDPTDSRFAHHANTLFYYRDYARSGSISAGDIKLDAMLIDETCSGDFRGRDGAASGVNLVVDVNRNGAFEPKNEGFDIRRPFNVLGTTYEIVEMAADGSLFQIKRSERQVAAPGQALDHRVGSKITSFSAARADGKTLHFPEDFKGQLVLLDFWATWCGPCIREMPHLTQAYEQYRNQGFEIVGVSIDAPHDAAKVSAARERYKMAWVQIHDQKIGELYRVRSIPYAYLVDGDTGEILAMGNTLRGQSLSDTIARLLDRKKHASPPQ